jgi:hypothetical protein
MARRFVEGRLPNREIGEIIMMNPLNPNGINFEVNVP